MPFEWSQTPTQAYARAFDYNVQVNLKKLYILYASYAPQIENYMKANAPWTDRTGNARQTLWARLFLTPRYFELRFGHGMPYGEYLEYISGGKYAIVGPTLDLFIPRLKRSVQEALQ